MIDSGRSSLNDFLAENTRDAALVAAASGKSKRRSSRSSRGSRQSLSRRSSSRSLASQSSSRSLVSQSSSRSLASQSSARRLVRQSSRRSLGLPRKRVRFEVDENRRIKEDYCQIPSIRKLSKEEKDACWWSSKDMTITRFELCVLSEHTSKSNLYYKDASHQLLNHCMRRDRVPLSEYAKRCMAGLVVAGKTRGLELHLSVMLQHHQKKAVAAALDTQKKMKTQKGYSSTQKAHMIALQYRRCSEYAANWAHIMAEGDEMIARR